MPKKGVWVEKELEIKKDKAAKKEIEETLEDFEIKEKERENKEKNKNSKNSK